MTAGAVPMGPFRGFVPYDEGAQDTFFGRANETARLLHLVLEAGARVSAVTGESGVGKTSLLRAGLVPALQKRGVVAVYVGAYEDLDGEILRAATRAGLEPPPPGHTASEYLARAARESRTGIVVIFDHLEEALGAEGSLPADLAAVLGSVAEAGGTRVRLVLGIDRAAFPRLEYLEREAGLAPTPGAWMTVDRLSEAQATEILERTVLQSGVFFENGLSAAIARDLCQGQACLPIELQLVAREVLDQRLTSVRKYQRAGGAAMLTSSFFDRLCADAGGRPARRALIEIAERGDATIEQLEAVTRAPRPVLTDAIAKMKTRGVLRTRSSGRADAYTLAHPALKAAIDTFAVADRAHAAAARRSVRRRLMSGERLRLREIYAVHRHLGGTLAPEEQTALTRSIRRTGIEVALGAIIVLGLIVIVYATQRRSYTLGLEPAGGGPSARVVVRLGRSSLSFFNFAPSSPRFGSVLADTGFAAGGLVPASAEKIAAGHASGKLDDATPSAKGRPGGVPGWLREVLNGLRPVPRGVAKALLGDPDGVTSLKHAFSDPLSRRETLEALAVIGRGGAGEDEILAAALTDTAPEIRRRGVEVAAAIDRRQGRGSHAATLRSALGDRSLDVRAAVLREAATLPAPEAASIITVALRDREPSFRRTAEEATLALAERAPSAAAEAVQPVLQSPDGGLRRSAMGLLERIAAKAPAACAGALARVIANEEAPEEARVAALLVLRRAGPPSADLKPVLEKAVRPEASPRLRAAALPLYARLIPPEAAEEIARAELKGAAAARAAGAAVWGAVAASHPEVAAKPLKALLFDPAVDTRIEAARSLAYLKREGVGLVDKALKDPNADVERAAIDSALALAPIAPSAIADMLGRATKFVRPGVRRVLIETLGRIGETRPAAVMPPLARALKDQDTSVRAAAATALCGLAANNAAATSPYLRIAARDDRHEVRTAAAACLGDLSHGDPKGAAKMAAELAGATEASVRAAAAESLGRVGSKARELAFPALLKLVADPEGAVRAAAVRGLAALSESGGLDAKRSADAERALNAALVQGDAEERRSVVAAAAKAGLAGVLRQATADGDETVRLDAVRAAGRLKPAALDVVRAAVDDRSNTVRAEATRILSSSSGAGAREVLPIFEAMLRGGDKAAREAAVVGVGDLVGAGEPGARLLGEALGQRSESMRAAAARALGHLAQREPAIALPHLERALRDPSHDVRSAAIPGLALAWSRKNTPAELASVLVGSEPDSARRLVALEALVIRAQSGPEREEARKQLARIGQSGPPLARLAAQIGNAFLDSGLPEMHAFIERLLGS